jgi:hypothetical protein
MTVHRLATIGILFAIATTGVVLISLFAGFQRLLGQPFAFIGSVGLATIMVLLILKVALVPTQRYTGWAKSITGPNGRWFFLILILLWIVSMGLLAYSGQPALVLGAFAFVGLLIGVFLFMGFIWAVIGE